MNAITLIWRQVLKELKLFQMKENKEDAVEKTDKEPQKTLKCHEDKYTVPLPDTAPPTGREKETERKQRICGKCLIKRKTAFGKSGKR